MSISFVLSSQQPQILNIFISKGNNSYSVSYYPKAQIPQELDEAMGGWWKDTLPAILASAPGHGLSETGLARPGARPASGSLSLGSHAGMKLGGGRGRGGCQGDVEGQ